MKIIKSESATTYTNAVSLSESVEYPFNDADIDCAHVKINGDYPGNGVWAVNEKSKELLFCITGDGVLEMRGENGTPNETYEFKQHDAIIINAGEVYRFRGTCAFCVVCTPPWTPEQHKNIN